MSDIAITDTPKLKKDKRGRFVSGHKGYTANRGGRPKTEHWLNQRIDEDLPAYYARMKHIALNGHEAHSVQAVNHLLNRRFGKPKVAVQVDSTVTQHFVVRVPPVMESAEAFERKYNPELNFIDVTPVATEAKPHEVYQAPELPVTNTVVSSPVPSGLQGHIGAAVPVFDAGDPANWRGQTQVRKTGGRGRASAAGP